MKTIASALMGFALLVSLAAPAAFAKDNCCGGSTCCGQPCCRTAK